MDIRSAYSAALSSLSTVQYQSSVTANNIANASVEGYSAQVVNLATVVTDGQATGVTVSSVSTYTDENLFKSYVSASSDAAYAETVATYLDRLLDAYGDTDSETTLSDKLTDLENALADLLVTPESQSLKYAVIEEAEDVADCLNQLSAAVQEQRDAVDQSLETRVAEVNEALQTIADLNREIALKTATGQDTSALEDARRVALDTVSDNLDVSYFVTGTGEMQVYTSTGKSLVDSQAHGLAYTAASVVNADTVFGSITLDGQAVDDSLKGGAIGALLELRDETLPAQQDALDEAASVLADTLNAVLNTGTSLPPASTITGQESFAGTDTFNGTGTFRIALVDSDGVVSSFVDLDLSSYSTVDDLVSAIDGISGISASLDANGHLVIESDDADLGVALSEMDSAVGGDNVGVSSYFGLNDLFTGSDASSIAVRSDLVDNPDLLATGVLSSDATLAVGDAGITSGDASVVTALKEALNENVSFDAAGSMSAAEMTIADYAGTLLSALATKTSSAEEQAETRALIAETLAEDISNQSGVNLDEETAQLTILENQYAAASQIISTLEEMFESLITAIG